MLARDCFYGPMVHYISARFLAGRAYTTMLYPSVVCNVCIVAKRCPFSKNRLKKQIRNGELNGHVTDDPVCYCLGPNISKTASDAI